MVRVRIDVLHMEFERSTHIRNLLVSYSETLLAQIQQTVACNALHTTQQRICRWLLMMHDRADGKYLGYTHEFLADVLGVNRKSVTLAAQALQGRSPKPGGNSERPGEREASWSAPALWRFGTRQCPMRTHSEFRRGNLSRPARRDGRELFSCIQFGMDDGGNTACQKPILPDN